MKIIHLGLSHTITDSRIFEKECKALSEQGYEVYYATSDCYESFDGIKAGIKIKTIPNTKNPYRYFDFFHYQRKKRVIFKDYLTYVEKIKPQVVHIHEFVLCPLIKPLRRKGYLVIYDLHEDNPGSQYWYIKSRYCQLIARIVKSSVLRREIKAMKNSNAVIAATPHLYDYAKYYNDNSELICNYPKIEQSIKPNEKKEPAFCFAGSISSINGIIHIIDAVNRTDGILYLAGKLENEVKNYIDNNNQFKRIIYLGYLSQNEVYTLYSKCLAGVVIDLNNPNNIDALPIKLFEFMNAELPVITSDFPLRREIVESSECGKVVNPDDIIEISNVMNEYLCDHQMAVDCGKKGKQAILTKYNWESQQSKLVKLYQTISNIL